MNFYPRSPRFCEPAAAREIARAIGGRILVVGVFVDADYESIAGLRRAVGFDCAQLHGEETPEFLARLLPHAYKALRVKDAGAVTEGRRYGGRWILLDAHVPGKAGGTGVAADWTVARQIASERPVILAGGLTSDNVSEAIAAVAPFGVDVANGVENAPGRKDPALIRAFVTAAKRTEAKK